MVSPAVIKQHSAGDPARYLPGDPAASPDDNLAKHYIGDHQPPTATCLLHSTLSTPGFGAPSRKCSRSTVRVQLHDVPCSGAFEDFKCQQGIDAKAYTAVVSPAEKVVSPLASYDTAGSDSSPMLYSDLLVYAAEVPTTSTTSSGAVGACDYKQDILTQSQMLKASDMANFVALQAGEI